MGIFGRPLSKLYPYAEGKGAAQVDRYARKDALRRLALARRGRLSPEERESRGALVVERLLALPEVVAASTLMAFVSISSEVPTPVLLEAVLAGGTRLLLPYVADDGALRAAPVASVHELEPGYRGIPEPRARIPVEVSMADVIVVPGVAFDERGGRLGYGGGFYDGLLRAAPAVPRIGICFEVQMAEDVPMTDHDERVDMVVTEERVIRCARLDIQPEPP